MAGRVMLQSLTFALCAIVAAGAWRTVAGLSALSLFGGVTIRCPAHWTRGSASGRCRERVHAAGILLPHGKAFGCF
jgi:hypothetical protein